MKPSDYVSLLPDHPDAPRHDFVDLSDLPFGLDIRYAREDNFLGRAVYPSEHAFLQHPAVESLLRAHHRLNEEGFGILVFDGYRPWSVTKIFHDETTEAQRAFLAHPTKGSAHNRGCAIDCSLFRLKDGQEVRMPSEFDEMGENAAAEFTGGTDTERKHRDLLIKVMHGEGFKVLKNEWWHFNHPSAAHYPIYDWSFSEILAALK
jgi:zinc D-Ala-D-Ala dipeptidase